MELGRHKQQVMNEELLRIEGLKTYFHMGFGVAKAVDGVTLTYTKLLTISSPFC